MTGRLAARIGASFAASCVGLMSMSAVGADAPVAPLDGTTANGDRIRLYPNGRWEYVETTKAEAQRPAIEAYEKERSLEQGGLLGIGRKVKPGDADYNRGSLGGKSR